MHKILVVDDSPKALEHIAKAAAIPDAEVITASSAKQAKARILEDTFDVIVTDLKMESDEAGLEVLKAAKEKDVSTQVIILTAYGTPKISVGSMSLGAFDYLEKNSPGTDVFEMIASKIKLALEFRSAKLAMRVPQ